MKGAQEDQFAEYKESALHQQAGRLRAVLGRQLSAGSVVTEC